MLSNAYWEGFLAARRGDERHCINPWNVPWLLDWYRGYDDAFNQ